MIIFPHTIIFWLYVIIGVISLIATIIVGIVYETNAVFWVLLTLTVVTLFTAILWIFFGGYRRKMDKEEIDRLRSEKGCPEFTTAVCGLDFDKVKERCQRYGSL